MTIDRPQGTVAPAVWHNGLCRSFGSCSGIIELATFSPSWIFRAAQRLVEPQLLQRERMLWRHALQAYGLRASMSEKGRCSDNASVETAFQIPEARTRMPTERADAATRRGRCLDRLYESRRQSQPSI